MHLLALSGSLRASSTNTALLRGLKAAARDAATVEVVTPAGLPLFDADREGPPAPPEVELFAARLARADGLVISCPEYIHALPGAFKNAIDWMVSRPEIIGKPVALLHGSSRGEDALAQLRLVLGTVSQNFWPDIHARFHLISMTPEAIAAHLGQPEQRAELRAFLGAFTTRIRATRTPE
jgi:chromate reductase, NAD(P)H dehydrogenase (quinone)